MSPDKLGLTIFYKRWGDVTILTDQEGDEYLELTERQTKTRTGATGETRKVPPRLWATSDPQTCPVSTYRLYASKRPHGLSNPEDPFYLSTSTRPVLHESDRWYISSRMGQKKIANIMKNMTAKCGISKRLTNHSARKHLVQKLRDNGMSPTDIMQISGHKNVQSIINYSNISMETQKTCSDILSDTHRNQNKTKTATVTNPNKSQSTASDSEMPASLPFSSLPGHFPTMHPYMPHQFQSYYPYMMPSTPMFPPYIPPPMTHPPNASNKPSDAGNGHRFPTHPQNGPGMFYGANVHIASLNYYGHGDQATDNRENH